MLTAANAGNGGTLTPMQVALIAGASGAVIEGGGEFIDELHDGEPINWGAVAARTVGGGAKGAMFSVPGLGTAKLAAGTVGIAAAENYLHSAAKGDVSAEALGKALANGTIEGVTAGLVDVAAKKVLGAHQHTGPEPKPELQIEPMPEAGQGLYLKPNIQLFAEKQHELGICYFRGTSQGYAGNKCLQKLGITPVSNDPLVATLFATESEQHVIGVLQIAKESTLEGLIDEGNVLAELEKEVSVNLVPLEFANKADFTISAKTARSILRKMGFNLPDKIYSLAQLDDSLRIFPRLTGHQISEFMEKVLTEV